ncbi:MAG: hypothetical protein WBS19_17615, partial [Candidatus Korobacteraceae bacterium]
MDGKRVLRRLLIVLGAIVTLAYLVFVFWYAAGVESNEAEADAAQFVPRSWWSLSQSATPTYLPSSETQVLEIPPSTIFVIKDGSNPEHDFFTTPYPSSFFLSQAELES